MAVTIVINGDIKESQRDVKEIKKGGQVPCPPLFISFVL